MKLLTLISFAVFGAMALAGAPEAPTTSAEPVGLARCGAYTLILRADGQSYAVRFDATGAAWPARRSVNHSASDSYVAQIDPDIKMEIVSGPLQANGKVPWTLKTYFYGVVVEVLRCQDL
ncbi:MAG: hypothetical protein AB7G93_21115 [Bdellovibrionales bacterium]